MTQRRTGATSGLVGREDEVRALARAVIDAPAVALVEGEEGIGKTRLVREMCLLPGVRQRRLLLGSCHGARDSFPLAAVIGAVRGIDAPRAGFSPLTGVLRPLLPELADKLPGHPGLVADELAGRHRVFRALRELLSCVATVCVLEDLHWADEQTVEFLQFLSADFPSQLALVLTYRREDVGARSPLVAALAQLSRAPFSLRIHLSPLGFDDVAALIGTLLDGGRVSTRLATSVFGWTAGIPFVVAEAIGALREGGHLEQVDRQWLISDAAALDAPAAVADAVLARVNRTSNDATRVAEAIAVIGGQSGEPVVAEVTALPVARCRNALVEALSAAVIHQYGEDGYGYRHALAERAVYASIAMPRRRELHLRAARALVKREPSALAAIARHYRLASRRRQWIQYAEAAADASRASGDERAAVRLLEDVLGAEDLPSRTRVRLALKLGAAALYGDAPLRAAELLRTALGDDSIPAPTRGELRLSLSRLLYHGGQGAEGREQLVRAVGELGRRPALAARAMINLALPWHTSGDATEHHAWLERAVAMAERECDDATRAAVALHRPAVLLYLGDRRGWEATSGLPAAGTGQEEIAQLVRGYDTLARACYLIGHYRDAERFLDEAERFRSALDHRDGSVWVHSTRALIHWATGRWGGLEGRAGRLLESAGKTSLVSSCPHNVAGWLALSRGRLELAESRFRAQQRQAHDTCSVPLLLAAAAGRAQVRLARGDAEGAVETSQLAVETMRRKGIWVWAAELAPAAVAALLAVGREDEAEWLTTELADGLEGRDGPASDAALIECRGAVAAAESDTGLGAELLGQARAAWQQLPRPYDAARAEERLGHCLLPSSFEDGAAALMGAFRAFQALGATWDSARVEAALRSTRIDLPRRWRGGRRSYGRTLSPREVEVARMAGTGMTNREIAQTLFLSPRTVEDHVGSVIRKLGLSSRNQLKNLDPVAMAEGPAAGASQ